jgi:hypothetical protein
MCYGDIDYGTDGYYRQHMEAAAREAEQREWDCQEAPGPMTEGE